MKKIKYFLQFICVIFFFVIFKILGLKLASIISSNIFILFGPIFRSNKIVFSNLKIAFPDIDENQKKQYLKDHLASVRNPLLDQKDWLRKITINYME